MLMFQVVERINASSSVKVGITDLYQNPTVHAGPTVVGRTQRESRAPRT